MKLRTISERRAASCAVTAERDYARDIGDCQLVQADGWIAGLASDDVIARLARTGSVLDAQALAALASALARDVSMDSGVVVSIDWACGRGVAVIACQATASDTAFDPAGFRSAFATFPDGMVAGLRAVYSDTMSALVVASACGRCFNVLPRLVLGRFIR